MKPVVLIFLLLLTLPAFSQSACPPNIGFENGNFNNWQSFSGFISNNGVINLRPGSRTQTLMRNAPNPEMDPYGRFPVVSPNGSQYSVKIGDDSPDNKAERLSYTFTVPANTDAYSIIFNYAVVLQNPSHQEFEQPRFTVRVYNLSRASYIECSSFDFIAGFNQPDFLLSDANQKIFYKPWASATINLNGYRGEQLRLDFTVTDCTLGGHFGYAYFDVVEKCQNALTGNAICPGTDELTLQAPAGFAGYQWYTGNFSQRLDTGNLYTIKRPVIGDSFAVVLLPYAYLGCQDTVYAKVRAVAEPIELHVKDSIRGCSNQNIDLTRAEVTAGSSAGLQYEYFTDSTAARYLPNPKQVLTSGVYYIKATNQAGCLQIKPVTVVIAPMPAFTATEPPVVTYPETVNLTQLPNNPQLSYTFWENEALTKPVRTPAEVDQSGMYYIKGFNAANCAAVQAVNVKIIPVVLAPSAFTPNGDGKNDRFIYKAFGGLKTIRFFNVYNRWGKEVFRTTTAGVAWDGTDNGKPAPSDTYVWIVEGLDWLDKPHTAKGTVVLIR